jgi:hypothetical protein
MESLQQPETFACHENSNAIARAPVKIGKV